MRLDEWIDRKRDGIVHTHDALRAGHTAYAIRAAVRAGRLTRVRRVWLVSGKAPGRLRRAAAAGGRVACVSAALHHKLWTIDDGRFHLTVPPHAGHARTGKATVHWGGGPLEPNRYELVEPIVNALWHIADCQPFENALATWESAVRSGRVSIDLLERFPLRSAAGRRVLAGCSQLSDSGIESIPVAKLARIGIATRQQVQIDGHHVDVLIGERLVLQIDGYEFHKSAEQRRQDLADDRRLRLMGYTVFRFGYDDVLFDWATIESEIRMAMAQGLHCR